MGILNRAHSSIGFTRVIAAVWFICSVMGVPLAAQKIEHPLDPLSFQEYWTALEVLRDAGRLNEETRFSIVNLHQPPKDMVWSWTPGQDFPRDAFAVVRQGADAFETIVDLKQRRVMAWTKLEGVQPNWLREEFKAMEKEVKKHPDFIAAMKKRGITDFTFLDCMAVPPGYFGGAEEQGKRIGHVQCKDTSGVRNTWTREIPGLTAIVDLNAKQVLRVVDEGVTPVAKAIADYDASSIGPPREIRSPIRIDQPNGLGRYALVRAQLRPLVIEPFVKAWLWNWGRQSPILSSKQRQLSLASFRPSGQWHRAIELIRQ